MAWFDKDLEIRYADTDAMGVVHHSTYALYCEMGRVHACAALGQPYHELEKEGIYLMVADMYCRYKAPIRFGDEVYVRTTIGRLTRRVFVFEYEIRRKDNNQLLFTGNTKHVVTHRTEGPGSMPAAYLEVFARGLKTA